MIDYQWGKSGIYVILNKMNHKIYVGSAVNLGHRWASHISLLKKGKHSNTYLQRAYIKYGEQCFEFMVIEETTQDKLIEREQFWLDRLICCIPDGYNICSKAGSTTGIKPTNKTISKIRARLTGSKRTAETKKRMSEKLIGNTRWLGKHHSDESREKCRIAKIGNKHAVGTKNGSAKLSEKNVIEIRGRLQKGERQIDIANDYGVSQLAISCIKTGKTWSHI